MLKNAPDAKSLDEMLDAVKQFGCFLKGTLIATESSLKAIEKIKKGEKVWAYNIETGDWQLKEIIISLQKLYSGDIITVTASDEEIKATGNHPFGVVSGESLATRPAAEHVYAHEKTITSKSRRVVARHLKACDTVLTKTAGPQKISKLTVEIKNTKVYNFSVKDFHCYSVTKSKILVHNSNKIEDNPCAAPVSDQVNQLQEATGKGQNFHVKTQKEAEELLRKARPDIEYRPTYEKPKVKKGAEIHPSDGSGIDKPHIKFKDWSNGKANGVEGHIYYDGI